jgi:hypothetical protein
MLEVIGVPCEVQTLTHGAANETRVTISFGDLVVFATGLDPESDPQALRGHCVQLKAHLGPGGRWISHGPIVVMTPEGVSKSSLEQPAPGDAGAVEATSEQTQASNRAPGQDARTEARPSSPAPTVQQAARSARVVASSPFASLASRGRAPAPSAPSGPAATPTTPSPSNAASSPPSQTTRISATLTPLRSATRSPASGQTPASPAPASRSAYGAAPERKRFDPNTPDSDLGDVPF